MKMMWWILFGGLSGLAVGNAAVDTGNLVELGRALYFDPRLSHDGTISCNSCHNLMHNGSDGRPGSVGVRGQVGGRKAPTVWNVGAYTSYFWDGRAATLEDQAKGPLTNPIEMGMTDHKAVEKRVAASGYGPQFVKTFQKEAITIDNIAKAIAAFETSLIVRNSPYDRYVAGDKSALTTDAKKGLELVSTLGCTSCHSGADFSGPTLSQGETFLMKFPTYPDAELEKAYRVSADTGKFSTTKKEDDRHMWRVPSWRNVALTAPYFHNGSAKTLPEAVKVMGKMQLNIKLKEDEIKVIVAFLKSLTSDLPKVVTPQLPIPEGTSLF